MKNILLIIDMQNGFARYGKTKETGEKIVELLKTNSFDYVIATQFINPLQGPYRRILNWEKLTSSPEIDLLEEIVPLEKILSMEFWHQTVLSDYFLRTR